MPIIELLSRYEGTLYNLNEVGPKIEAHQEQGDIDFNGIFTFKMKI